MNSVIIGLDFTCACAMERRVIIVVVLASFTVMESTGTEIISFTQSSEAVRSGESMIFECRVNADEAEWRIDGFPTFYSDTQNGLTIQDSYSSSRNPPWILRLTMEGDQNDGKRISCYAASTTISGDITIRHKYFIIADRPAPPVMDVRVQENGTSLNVSWEEPHYYSNYPITGYTLEVENETTGEISTLVHNTRALSYEYSLSEVATDCHLLNFSVTAYSVLGNVTSHHQLVSFPRAPEPVDLIVELSFASDLTPRLNTRSTFTDPCLHEGTEYSIVVRKHNAVVAEVLRTELSEEFVLTLEVNEGLVRGELYTVVATGSNVVGSSSLSKNIQIELSLDYADGCNRSLSVPPNGHVRITSGQYGLLAIYTCDDNSVITRDCLTNTSWFGAEPFCPSVNCDRDLSDPPNGHVHISTTQSGLVATYTCDDGSVLNRTCLPNASWSGGAPMCMVPTTVPAASTHGSTLATASTHGTTLDVSQSSDFNNTLIIAVLAVLLGVVIGIVVSAIGIIACCVYRRRTKTINALEQPRRKPPSTISLPLSNPQKCATNPIYEGGSVYDSPSEPFKALLSMGSTPSTPTTPSPRYFNMPPQLPPPRKTSISSPFSPTFCTSPTLSQTEKIQASFNMDVPPAEDPYYTVMKPAATKGISRPNKPSPLVLPNSSLNTHDEYVSII